MRKSIIERLVLMLLVVGLASVGCDSVKNAIDDTKGKGVQEVKEKEKQAAEKQVVDDKAKADAERRKMEESIAADAAKEKAKEKAKVVDDDADKDFKWTKENSYTQGQLLVRDYMKGPAGVEFPSSGYTVNPDPTKANRYTVRSSAHSRTQHQGNWTWAHDWAVTFTSVGGKAVVDYVEIGGKPYFANGVKLRAGISKAAVTQANKAAKSEERKASVATNRPAAAASMLKIAKQFKAEGKEEKATDFFHRVIDKYPETDAATEARVFLGEAPEDGSGTEVASGDAKPGLRTWTDKSGKHKIEAELVSSENGTVKLKKSDGTVVPIQVDKLSEDDQEFLRQKSGG